MDGSRDRNRAAKVMQGRQQAQKGLNEGSLSRHFVQNKRHGNHWLGTHLATKEPTCMSNYRDLLLATGFPGGSDGKESACDARDPGSIPGKIPWRRIRWKTWIKFSSHLSAAEWALETPCTKSLQPLSVSCCPYGLQSARVLCPWDFPGKNTGVGCHFLLQGIFPTQALNLCLLCLLHWH